MMRAWIIAAVVTLSGCASAPTAEQLAAADYGPAPANYEVAIRAYFNQILKDPSSLQVQQITQPEHGYVQGPPLQGAKVTYGWLVRATINAKNSYGGYVGFQTYQFLFRGDLIVDTVSPEGL